MRARKSFAKLRSDERGATAIEYGLIIAMIVIGLMVGLDALAAKSTGLWGTVDSKAGKAIYAAVG